MSRPRRRNASRGARPRASASTTAARKGILGMESFALPSIEEVIDLTIRLGSRTNPAIRCGGVSLTTSAYDADAAEALMAAERQRLGLPVTDPTRGGASFAAPVENYLACVWARHRKSDGEGKDVSV